MVTRPTFFYLVVDRCTLVAVCVADQNGLARRHRSVAAARFSCRPCRSSPSTRPGPGRPGSRVRDDASCWKSFRQGHRPPTASRSSAGLCSRCPLPRPAPGEQGVLARARSSSTTSVALHWHEQLAGWHVVISSTVEKPSRTRMLAISASTSSFCMKRDAQLPCSLLALLAHLRPVMTLSCQPDSLRCQAHRFCPPRPDGLRQFVLGDGDIHRVLFPRRR